MKMQLPVQQFPILTPGQMNPYNQAVQSGLEAYTKNIQAAYAKPEIESKISSTLPSPGNSINVFFDR
jgi:hypothetical protein